MIRFINKEKSNERIKKSLDSLSKFKRKFR